MLSTKLARSFTVAGALIAVLASSPRIVQAQFGFRVPIPGIGGGGIIIAPPGGTYYGAPRRGHHGTDTGEQPKDSGPKVSLSSETTNTVFKSMVVSKGLGAVGVEEPIDTAKKDWGRESERDYVGAIQSFLKRIDDASKNPRGDSSLAQGDVTQHAIDQSVSQAYERKGFANFEQYVGEQWTNERLRVAILDRANAKLPGLLVGNNRGRVTMDQIKEIIDQAADGIYEQTRETSELVAVNQATARFTRALFESQTLATDSNLRDGVEDMLLTASKVAFVDYEERFVRSGELGVVMHYRAERILVDCLTANITEITTTKDDKAASKEEMRDKVKVLAEKGECRKWVETAIGDPRQNDPKADDQMLKPYPVRAIWVAAGEPKTDASMYRRVTSNP
jgi:hypothetical protein